jgi:hypothetical protein
VGETRTLFRAQPERPQDQVHPVDNDPGIGFPPLSPTTRSGFDPSPRSVSWTSAPIRARPFSTFLTWKSMSVSAIGVRASARRKAR